MNCVHRLMRLQVFHRHAAKKKKSKKKREQLSSVQMAGKRLFGQIEDILDYTEIDTNKTG